MKKALILIGIISLILPSCSNDENNSVKEELFLPKSISYTYQNHPEENYKSVMIYNENKIVSMNNGAVITRYTYDGNLITKLQRFSIDSQGKESKVRDVTYSYANGKLVKKIMVSNFSEEHPAGNFSVTTTYNHNTDGTISSIVYMPNSTDIDYTGILTYQDKNLIKSVLTVISDPSYGTEIDVYEYDIKNNPLKNILGFDLLLGEISFFGSNNVLKLTRTTKQSSEILYQPVYLYDQNSYPTKVSSNPSGLPTYERNEEYTY